MPAPSPRLTPVSIFSAALLGLAWSAPGTLGWGATLALGVALLAVLATQARTVGVGDDASVWPPAEGSDE